MAAILSWPQCVNFPQQPFLSHILKEIKGLNSFQWLMKEITFIVLHN